MKVLQKLRIRNRLTAGFLAVFVMVGASAVFGVWKLTELQALVDTIVTDDAQKLALAQRWERDIAVNLVRTHTSLLLDDATMVNEIKRDMDVTSTQISATQAEIEAMPLSDDDKAALAQVSQARAKYREERSRLQSRRASSESVAEDLSSTLDPLAAVYLGAIRSFVDTQQRDLNAARESADEKVRRARTITIVLGILGFAIALSAAASIARSIVVPVARARESALRIASGDLTQALEAHGSDEIAELTAGLAQMQESLRGIATRVRSTAQAVSSASTQIAAGNTDLSSRTEEQASSLQQTAASIEEMTAAVNQNARNAATADEVASSAAKVAQRGGEAVDEVVRTMESIQESSKRIADITGVIDSIAFQTNILALNAAVEAARAGEQGRGFAVVAAEVRSLAQRSAGAAKEIKGLIADSVERVQDGGRLASDAGRTMIEVVESVTRVSGIIAEIANATNEQSSGIVQVNTAVSELDKATQQNAALVEESTAASESLRLQAIEMVDAVAVFKLGSAEAATEAPANTAARKAAPAQKLASPRAAPALPRASGMSLATAGGAITEEWKEF